LLPFSQIYTFFIGIIAITYLKVFFFQVLKICCKIRHLNLTFNNEVNLMNLLRMNFQVPKLEVLDLSHTEVNYGTLYVISKNCCGLLHLLLEHCCCVTDVGVKVVLENCTQLREISLRGCDRVHANVVSMMLSRPSLRKIIVPHHYRYRNSDFSRQRCLVCYW
jgi:hypothetical protein